MINFARCFLFHWSEGVKLTVLFWVLPVGYRCDQHAIRIGYTLP